MNQFTVFFLFCLTWSVFAKKTKRNESQGSCMLHKSCRAVGPEIIKALSNRMLEESQRLDITVPFTPGTFFPSSSATMPCVEEQLDLKIADFYAKKGMKERPPTCQTTAVSDAEYVCFTSSYSCGGFGKTVSFPAAQRQVNLEKSFSKFCLRGLSGYLLDHVPSMPKKCRESLKDAKDFCQFSALFFQ